MYIKNIITISLFSLILGACGVAPLNDSVPVNNGRVIMNVGAGKYEHYIAPYTNRWMPTKLTAKLLEPRQTTQWIPSMMFCAQGKSLDQRTCLWFTVFSDGKSGGVTSYSGADPIEAEKGLLPTRFHTGQLLQITIQLEKNSFSLLADGKQIYKRNTEFDVEGHSFGCVSARCEFDFLE